MGDFTGCGGAAAAAAEAADTGGGRRRVLGRVAVRGDDVGWRGRSGREEEEEEEETRMAMAMAIVAMRSKRGEENGEEEIYI